MKCEAPPPPAKCGGTDGAGEADRWQESGRESGAGKERACKVAAQISVIHQRRRMDDRSSSRLLAAAVLLNRATQFAGTHRFWRGTACATDPPMSSSIVLDRNR